ncbi:Hypothetical predicted protein [Mytilus galloprovincialis]|uniref:Uncharacterized protein n=1 Tax=Mytilus galloprovincialis TaxID=29158 RepID=A0A8B6HLL4_MYTGA|nr:Hypothetical predicted protein [Mytilus galloprovincialis]
MHDARPQVLIFLTMELHDIARQNNVEFVELPAHTSHWLQPLDRKPKSSKTSTQSIQSSLQSSISSPKKKNEKKKSNKKETVEIHNWGGESVWDLLSDIDDSSTSKSLPSSSSKKLTSSSSTKSTTAPSPLRSPEKKDVQKKPVNTSSQKSSDSRSRGMGSRRSKTSCMWSRRSTTLLAQQIFNTCRRN